MSDRPVKQHIRGGSVVSAHTRRSPAGASTADTEQAAAAASAADGRSVSQAVREADRLRGHRLIEDDAEETLLANGRQALIDEDYDATPVVKVFGGSITYLIAEIDPREPDQLFGLADHGHGFPEMGWFSRREIEEARYPPYNMPLERDLWWTPSGTLVEYAEAARAHHRFAEIIVASADASEPAPTGN